jgi:hypothetical protein
MSELDLLKKGEHWFWGLYLGLFVLLFCFTNNSPLGYESPLGYHLLPHEHPGQEDEVLVTDTECGDEGLNCRTTPLQWQDKKTGELYGPGDFVDHRRDENKRRAPWVFLYGYLGALAFAFFRRTQEIFWHKAHGFPMLKEDDHFAKHFGIGALIAAACALGMLFKKYPGRIEQVLPSFFSNAWGYMGPL